MAKFRIEPWKPRGEMDTFKLFLIVAFWLVVLGIGMCFVSLWWGLSVIAAVVMAVVIAVMAGGF